MESYENDKLIYIVMEHYEGKQLFDMIVDRVDDNEAFTEAEVNSHPFQFFILLFLGNQDC